MLSLLVAGTMAVLPLVMVVALLLLAERLQRARQTRVAWQIAVTDAIHRELGAVVAPSVSMRPWGPPRLVIPAPLGHPGLVAAVLAIAHRVLRSWDGVDARRVQIVVIPQNEPRPAPLARAA